MSGTLDSSQKKIRDEVALFARETLNSGARERDQGQLFPMDLWKQCGELRLQGLVVPTDCGGRGLDPLSAAAAIEGLGYGCRDGGLAFAVCAHLLACVVPICKHGTDEQKRRLLPPLSDGRMIAANAMTEPASGSDAFSLTTEARADDAGFVVDGHKTFVSNGPIADIFVLYAATNPGKGFHGGISAFLIPSGTSGVERGPRVDKMSLRTCQMGDVTLRGVRVGRDALLGEVGGGGIVFAQSMEWERVLMSALHVGTMERLLEDSVAYARVRKTAGGSIGKRQAVSHRIADMKVRLEAARAVTYRAASLLDAGRESGLAASIAKIFVSESLVATARDAVANLGGYGVLTDHDAERALRDATAATVYSGTSDIQRNIVARWLGL